MWWCSSTFGLRSILYSFVLRGMVMYDNVFEKKKTSFADHIQTFKFDVPTVEKRPRDE